MYDLWEAWRTPMRERAGRHPGDPYPATGLMRCKRIVPLVHGWLACRRHEGHTGVHQWGRVTHGS